MPFCTNQTSFVIHVGFFRSEYELLSENEITNFFFKKYILSLSLSLCPCILSCSYCVMNVQITRSEKNAASQTLDGADVMGVHFAVY